MSTQPPTTTMQTPPQTGTARTTDATTSTGTQSQPSRFRSGRDRWRAADEPEPEPEPPSAASQAPRTFDPFCQHRLPNPIDDANQAMLRDRTRDSADSD